MIRVWDATLQAYKDIEGLRIRRPDGVLVDAQVARKRVGSAWVDVWPENLYLYKPGDECVAVTGGWGTYPYRFGANPATNNTAKTPTITKTAKSITLFEPSGYYRGSLFTEQPISMAGYNRLKVHVVSASAKKVPEHNAHDYIARSLVCIPVEKKDSYAEKENVNIIQSNDITIQNLTVEIDISKVNEKRYLAFTFMTVASNMSVEFDRVWLEK